MIMIFMGVQAREIVGVQASENWGVQASGRPIMGDHIMGYGQYRVYIYIVIYLYTVIPQTATHPT